MNYNELPPVPGAERPGTAVKVCRIILAGLLAVIFILALGGCFVLMEQTFITLWIPLSMGVGLGCGLGWLTYKFWRWLARSDRKWLNAALGIIFFAAFSMATLLSVNYYTAVHGEESEQKAEVTQLLKKKKHHTKRVGRRYVATGSVYYVYEVTMQLPGNREATIGVPADVYSRLHKGDSLRVKTAVGAMGWEVLDRSNIVYPKKRPKSRRHTRRVYGTHINSHSF